MTLLEGVDCDKMTKEEERLRDGIFNLGTIRFGKIPEIMIKKKYDFSIPIGTTEYDLISDKGERIEVKFSCVREKEADITEDNALSVCLENAKSGTDRKVNSYLYEQVIFDCNIQQIKPDLFEVIYYGLFFEDRIIIFKMESKDMLKCFTAKYFSKVRERIAKAEKKLREAKEKFEIFSDGKRSEKYILKRIEKDIPSLLLKIGENLREINASESKSYKGAKDIIAKADLLKSITKTVNYITDSSKQLSKRICKCNQLLEKLRKELVLDTIPNSSAKQHLKSDGEGQFHIKNTNFKWHLDSEYFQEWITYRELYELLKSKE